MDEGFVPVQPESLEIRATNDGRRPAYVPQIGLVLSDGCRLSYFIADDRQKLEEGQTVVASVPKSEIIRHTAQHPFGTKVVGLYAGLPRRDTQRHLSPKVVDDLGLRPAFGMMPEGLHAGKGHPANKPPFREPPAERTVEGIPATCLVCGKALAVGDPVGYLEIPGEEPRAWHKTCDEQFIRGVREALGDPLPSAPSGSEE